MSSPSPRSDGPAPAPVSIARGIRPGGDEFWTFAVKLLRTSKGALHAGEASARHDAETVGFTANRASRVFNGLLTEGAERVAE